MPKSIHSHTTKHTTSPTYKSWHMMKQRCTNPKNTQYKDYGGRGIDIHHPWMCFGVFLADMGERPPGTSLERRDNNKGYRPDNCYWATRTEQQRNRRTNVWLELDGVRMLLTDWARKLDLEPHSLHQRLKHGWDLRRALTTPAQQRGRRNLSTRNVLLEMMKEQAD